MAAQTDTGGGGPSRQLEGWVVDLAIKLLLLGLFAWWSLQLVAPFVIVVIWAAILATAIYPLHAWLARLLGGRPTISAVLITLLGLGLILGPAAALATSLAGSLQGLATDLAAGALHLPAPDASVKDWPVVGERVYEAWSTAAADLPGVLAGHQDLVVRAGTTTLGLAAGLGADVLIFAASVVLAGFFYGRGARLADGARRFGQRLVPDRGSGFVDLAGATVRNVSRGVIGIALLQALLAGIGLMVAGVPGAGLITLGVLVLAIIQIGPGILLIPVTIWIWAEMDTLTAALFTAYIVPVLLFDNVLKPIVMARGLKTPMLVIFIGVIGGTLTHGLIGLFLGPIILAVFYELVVAWLGTTEPPVAGAPPEEPAAT